MIKDGIKYVVTKLNHAEVSTYGINYIIDSRTWFEKEQYYNYLKRLLLLAKWIQNFNYT